MALSNDLAIQFAKVTNNKTKTTSESTVYATVVTQGNDSYVQVDGSEVLTPIESTVSIKDGQRVLVKIKDHKAIVTGNITDPSASSDKVIEVDEKIGEFKTIMADKITTDDLTAINATITKLEAVNAEIGNIEAITATIETLKTKYAEIENINADTVKALDAEIENLRAKFAEIDDLTAENLEVVNASIDQLKGYNAEFTYVSAEVLKAVKADIKTLDTEKLSAESADIRYATIDFANITEASIEKLFSESGIIRDLVMSEGHVTGKLVGVTIVGDLIEGGTVKADKLVVQGEDGLYYKLNVNAEKVSAEQTEYNSLSGSIITAKSITAEKVNVNDLVAFGATIGGFKITDKSIYSGVKKSADNTTRGIYLDKDGQIAFGDSSNFLRYYLDQNGDYKLEISANSIKFGATNKSIEETLNNIEAGAVNLIRNSNNMIYEDYYFDEVDTAEVNYLVDSQGNMLLTNNDDILIV